MAWHVVCDPLQRADFNGEQCAASHTFPLINPRDDHGIILGSSVGGDDESPRTRQQYGKYL
jgi:hypothetical protein